MLGLGWQMFDMCNIAKAMVSGRVRDSEGKKMIAKEMQNMSNDMPTFDLTTGAIKAKKQKKEKSAEDQSSKELKTLEKKQPV